MKSLNSILAKDIMSSELKSVDVSDDVNKALSILRNENLMYVLVYDGKKYEGIFGYKHLLRAQRKPARSMKVGAFLLKPPSISPETGIVEISDILYRLNMRILPVEDDKNKIIGVVSESDVVKALLDYGNLSGKKVSNYMTPLPLTINEDSTIGEAIAILRESNVSRLIVVNDEEKLSGILDSTQVIKELSSKERYMEGKGAALAPVHAMITGNVPQVIGSIEIPVKSVMSGSISPATMDDDVAEKLTENLDIGESAIAVVDDDGYALGIVTPKDIIQQVAALKEGEKFYIQLSGFESIEMIDDFQKAEMHGAIDRTVKKIARMLDISGFTVHAKAYQKEGKQAKYSFRCKMSTNNGIISAKNYDWDPIKAVSDLMEEVERLSKKSSEKDKDIIISKARDTKYSE